MLEKILIQVWYNNKYKILYYLLSPFAFLYNIFFNFNKYLYFVLDKLNIKNIYKSKIPVISIGNITVGGTGKTIVVISLVKYLKAQGYNPAVILRGYNANINSSKNKNNFIKLDADTDVNYCGDEAKLIYNNTECTVVAGSNRVNNIRFIEKHNLADIIISDDGLQNHSFYKNIKVCIVDGVRLFGNKTVLPAGPLREKINNIKNYNYLLVKNNFISNKKINPDFNKLGDLSSSLMSIEISGIFNYKQKIDNQEIENLTNNNYSNIYLYSGIGNNKNFFDSIDNYFFNKLDKNNFIEFPDHYHYTITDFNKIYNNKSIVITTEKDYVKIYDLLKNNKDILSKIYYLKISAVLPDDFLDKINNNIKIII